MEVGIEAARWVVGKALGPTAGGVLEAWADSSDLGPNIRSLRMELLYAQGMLNNARDHDDIHDQKIKNPALAELVQELQDLAYRADDVLDEIDYFRIQDDLDKTYHAADEHGGGCLCNHALNASHTAKAIAKMLGLSKCSARHDEAHEDSSGRRVSCGDCSCLGLNIPSDDDEQEEEAGRRIRCGAVWPCGRSSSLLSTNHRDQEAGDGCMSRVASGARDIIHIVGKHLPCYSVSPVQNTTNSSIAPTVGRHSLFCACLNKAPQTKRPPKLKFDRVKMSRTVKEIVKHLKPLCAKVSAILNLEFLAGNYTTPQRKATNRITTTSESIEPQLYGREDDKRTIIHEITKGECCDMGLTVLPIVGPGGIGKTALMQDIFHDKEVQGHFEVKEWVCVSLKFNVQRLTQEIADKLQNDKKDSPDKWIEERLKSKRFLLILDDIWDCSNEDEWNRFLVPFRKGQKKGSVIIVTTRFPGVAQVVKPAGWKDLKGIDKEEFKKLFLACVFGDKQQPTKDQSKLLDIGDKIVENLKGSPLAAKTVGRLLRKHLDWGHWTRVFESKEWGSMNEDNGIMPALKLSFDYLPFHLQQCFTYCALFPEDYRFRIEELIHFWIGLDLLHSRGANKSIEELGQSYLKELVEYGFFKEEEDEHGDSYYTIHDLLHELAKKVSEDACLSIFSSNSVRSLQIAPSIRHLSINIDESSVKDKKTFDICVEEFSVLEKMLKVENLHSLMLFGKHQGSFVKIFRGLIHKAKDLRVIFISGGNYNMEDLFNNVLNLVHLRYLRIHNDSFARSQVPSNVSRFYHLRVLDLQGRHDFSGLPGDMIRNLIKLRHFLVSDDKIYSTISEVGRLKSIQELRRFEVEKESNGFELRQMGHLLELRGSLIIDNLETVERREDADEAKLMHKKHLHELTLNWNTNRSNNNPAHEEQVLEGLKPHSNLLKLSIRGHGASTRPSWLGVNLSVKNLRSLCLDGVAWEAFPPIGELHLINGDAEEKLSNISHQHFNNLERIELVNLAMLKRWVLGSSDQLLPHLEVLIIKDCPALVELSFSNSTCSHKEQKTRFPKLQELTISSCPKLLSLPAVPWTSARCSISISGVGLGFESLHYGKDPLEVEDVLSLRITGNNAQDSASFWVGLNFGNVTERKKLVMSKCPPLPLDSLQMLSSSLKILEISDLDNSFWPVDDGSHVGCKFPVLELMRIARLGANGKELTQVLSCMPKLAELEISRCEKITGLGVVKQQQEAERGGHQQRQHKSREEEEIATEGLLLLPPQLQMLGINDCPEISLCPNSLHDENGGLQALCSLRSLWIWDCPKFLAYYLPSSSSCFPFPTSLQSICLSGVETPAPLSNLASLTLLQIIECGGLGGVDFGHLLTHGCLNGLSVTKTPNFFPVGWDEPPQMVEQGHSFPLSKLQWLSTDDITGVIAEPICRLLSSSLTSLILSDNEEAEGFTEEQDEALQLLTNLQQLEFCDCNKLQCLPAGLHRLTNLKTLAVGSCPAIRSLHKDSLPNSLQVFQIFRCPAIRSLPKDGLPDSLRELWITSCPSIRALPKGGLPSSLQVLQVWTGNSEELTRQCRELIGTIPIVTLY